MLEFVFAHELGADDHDRPGYKHKTEGETDDDPRDAEDNRLPAAGAAGRDTDEPFGDEEETEGERAKVQQLGDDTNMERSRNLSDFAIFFKYRGIRKRPLQVDCAVSSAAQLGRIRREC